MFIICNKCNMLSYLHLHISYYTPFLKYIASNIIILDNKRLKFFKKKIILRFQLTSSFNIGERPIVILDQCSIISCYFV